MEKYGVEVDPEKEKTANEGEKKCPTCGSDLSPGNVPHCPKCGTKPFEQQEMKTTNFRKLYGG
jgi:hypothetical protein